MFLNAFVSKHSVSKNFTSQSLIGGLSELDYNMKVVLVSHMLYTYEDIPNMKILYIIIANLLELRGINENYNFMSLKSGGKVYGRLVKEFSIMQEITDCINMFGAMPS